jgi:hypothetical protein
MTLLWYSKIPISVLAADGFDGYEAEFDDVAYDDCEDERNNRPWRVAEALAKRLNDDDREQGSKSKEEAIGNEVAGAFRGCRCCPVEIERMQESPESEENKEQQSLTKN